MNFKQRSYQKELLDRNDIPFAEIERNMLELDFINTHLGGHSITIAGLKELLSQCKPASKKITICEIGCGGGNNLREIHSFCKKKNIDCKLIGIDINPDCIAFARQSNEFSAEWITSDYRNLHFEKKPDIIFNSLFCHHFTDKELLDVFTWMKSNAAYGFFVNDLHRNPVAYHSIKMLTGLFSKSRLVKNDAPLSVLRGFSKNELQQLLIKAGIKNFTIKWKWAFRWLIIATTHEQ